MFKKLRKSFFCALLCSSFVGGVSPLLASGRSSLPWWETLGAEEGAAASAPQVAEPTDSAQEPEVPVLDRSGSPVVVAPAASEASSVRPRVFGIRQAVDRLRAVRPSGMTAENFWNAEFSGTHILAIERFWNLGGEEAAEECVALRREVLQIAQNNTYSEHLMAMNVLWYAPVNLQENEDRSLLWPHLVQLAQDPSNPCQWRIIEQLWFDGRMGAEKSCVALHPILLQIGRTYAHSHQWDAIRKLCDVWYVQREQGRTDLWDTLLEMVQDFTHPQHWLACYELWDFGGPRGRTNAILLRVLTQAAQNFDDTLYQWQAITRLWHSGGEQQAQNRIVMRPLLMRIVPEQEHPYQREALRFLVNSDDPHDQALGLQLQYQYFEEIPGPPAPIADGGGA